MKIKFTFYLLLRLLLSYLVLINNTTEMEEKTKSAEDNYWELFLIIGFLINGLLIVAYFVMWCLGWDGDYPNHLNTNNTIFIAALAILKAIKDKA